MTYSSLLDDLRRYLERGFTEASDRNVFTQLPKLINLAERNIASQLKLQGFQRTVKTMLQANQAVYQKPDRWRDTISISVGGLPVLARSYEYVRNYWPDESQTGQAEFYADYDYQHWIFVPTPPAPIEMQVMYYELPRLLDESNQTNWLTTYAPNLLLYAALLEATPFVKDDARIAVWQQSYQLAAAAFSKQDTEKIMDRSSARNEA